MKPVYRCVLCGGPLRPDDVAIIRRDGLAHRFHFEGPEHVDVDVVCVPSHQRRYDDRVRRIDELAKAVRSAPHGQAVRVAPSALNWAPANLQHAAIGMRQALRKRGVHAQVLIDETALLISLKQAS